MVKETCGEYQSVYYCGRLLVTPVRVLLKVYGNGGRQTGGTPKTTHLLLYGYHGQLFQSQLKKVTFVFGRYNYNSYLCSDALHPKGKDTPKRQHKDTTFFLITQLV